MYNRVNFVLFALALCECSMAYISYCDKVIVFLANQSDMTNWKIMNNQLIGKCCC